MIEYIQTQVIALSRMFWDKLPEVTAAIAVLVFVWLLSRVSGWFVARLGAGLRLRKNLLEVLSLVLSVTIWLIGSLIALTLIFPTITPAKALTTLGLGSVAIGFAFKDTFENFLAGLLILLREPFEIGDYIACSSIEGQIEQITIRESYIRQTDGQLVVVPNNLLFQNPVTVRTSRDLRRVTIICGIAYSENVDAARDVINAAVKAVDTVRDDVKDVQVFAHEFGASSIDFEVSWWTGSQPRAVRESKDQVVAAVKAALDDAGIEIPFPYRTLTVAEPIPVKSVS